MPGHAGSPYWAAVDFDSEGDDVPTPPPTHRVYLDPWDTSNDTHGIAQLQPEKAESIQDENFNSFAGEPVSASFYYVPTKNYDSGEDPPLPPPRKKMSVREDHITDDYAVYGRKMSRATIPEIHAVYGERPISKLKRKLILY